MLSVGIIANPASGKDIRRLVAYGTVFDNLEKVNIVRRILLALAATGVERVFFMPDYYGIVPRAVVGLSHRHRLPLEIVTLEMELTATQEDSAQAAAILNQLGVGCIITMGGDGTNRMVAKGCGEVPLLPISTGTNNVFPEMVEGTTAGLAAGVVAGGLVSGPPAILPSKKLIIYKNGLPVDVALVDAVVLIDDFIGSRAVWDAERIRQIIVTRGQAHNIGISSIAGNLEPVGKKEEKGLAVRTGRGNPNVIAPIAPGLIQPVTVQDYKVIDIGEEIEITDVPCLIALDGEREVEVKEGEKASVKLTFDGPRVIDVRGTLREAALSGCFRGENAVEKLAWLKEEE
ncbi:MAG: ATP-NAD kinase [Syntrophomonadaceae bacterium]|nr:ATP-NAD kinase [Syntrophomonadaceae bacterium]